MKRITLIALSLLVFVSPGLAQDVPGGTRITPTVAMLKHFKTLDALSVSVLKNVNARLGKCRLNHSPYKNIVELHDHLQAMESLSKVSNPEVKQECDQAGISKKPANCIIHSRDSDALQKIAKDPYFTTWQQVKFPTHPVLSPIEFLAPFHHD